MLRLDADVRFLTTATIHLKALQASFQVECRLLSTDRLNELRDKQTAGEMTPAQFVGEWLTGWPDGEVTDSSGQPMAFSAESVAKLLAVPGAPLALVKAFYKGYDEATEGNSEPLPAG